jgi:isopentenyldiphosphate isomerase
VMAAGHFQLLTFDFSCDTAWPVRWDNGCPSHETMNNVRAACKMVCELG